MANTDIADMRKKLLEMQNELLKESVNKHESAGPASPPPAAAPAPAPAPAPAQPSESDEVISLLKEIRSNQHRMLQILLDINTKIR